MPVRLSKEPFHWFWVCARRPQRPSCSGPACRSALKTCRFTTSFRACRQHPCQSKLDCTAARVRLFGAHDFVLQLLELSAHRARLRPRQRRLQRAAHNFELPGMGRQPQPCGTARARFCKIRSLKRGLTWASAACRLRRSCSESERARAICGETGEVGIGEGSPPPSPAQPPLFRSLSSFTSQMLAGPWHQ